MKYIQMADIFGVPYRQQITLHDKVQKSVLGGVTSLIIVIASLAYLCYIMSEWINSNILPKSSSTMKVENYSQIIFNNDSLFEFSYWKYAENQIDPFRSQNNILTPIGVYVINGVPQQPFSLIRQQEELSNYDTSLMYIDNLTLIQNSGLDKSKNYTTELMIMITRCDQSYLTNNQTCATESEIDSFFDLSVNYISFWLNLKQYNPYSQQFEVVKKQYYLTLDSQISHQGQLILTQSDATIDTGILFGRYSYKNYVNNAQLITSATQVTFWSTLLAKESYFNLFIRLDPISYEIQIVYPKLGEVLASVGSIVSTLLMVRYVIEYYNEYLLDCSFIDKVLKFYFSDYESIKKSKTQENTEICKDLIQSAKKKLVYTNIVYELSRIQLFLLHHYGRTKLEESHQYRLQAKIALKTGQCCEIYDKFINTQRPEFDKQDFNLLCKMKSRTVVVSNLKENSAQQFFQEIKSPSLKSVKI